MTDKYTELAREELAGYRPLMADTPNIYNALITQVATLLRRVARETLLKEIEYNDGTKKSYERKLAAADPVSNVAFVLSIRIGEALLFENTLRSRSKELED